MKKQVIFIFLFLVSCASEEVSINQSNSISLEDERSNVNLEIADLRNIDSSILIGQNFEIEPPLKIAYGGDRFSVDYSFKKGRVLEYSNPAVANYFKEDENFLNNDPSVLSYGYVCLTDTSFIELFTYGWNDKGMTDYVKVFSVLIFKNFEGNIFNVKIEKLIDNIDDVKYTEFIWSQINELNLVKYNFNDSMNKANLSKEKYRILLEGDLIEEERVSMGMAHIDNAYNDFINFVDKRFIDSLYNRSAQNEK